MDKDREQERDGETENLVSRTSAPPSCDVAALFAARQIALKFERGSATSGGVKAVAVETPLMVCI